MNNLMTSARIVAFPTPAVRTKPKTIVIGDIARWQAQGINVAPINGLKFVAIDALCADTLRKFSPETILSPLIADTFDAYDVAQLLSAYAYEGPYCAISGPLPNRDGVMAEVKKSAPGVQFDIFVVAG